MNTKSKILIVNPLFRDLFINHSQNILKNKFEVDEFFIHKNNRTNNFLKYFHKIINLINIHFLKKRDYYRRLEKKRQSNYYQYCLNNVKNKRYDKILICRGDRLPHFVLKNLQIQSKKMINYQCDGVEMCPDIFKKKKYFTSIYSFEKEDIIKYPDLDLKFITNFYFNYNPMINKKADVDFYYLGVGLEDRIKILDQFTQKFKDFNAKFLVTSTKPNNLPKSVTHLKEIVNYQSNLDYTIMSKCIIDLKMDVHNGLSFRFFEALYYQKKLITNNTDIINYEFYNPNNIMIIDYNNYTQASILEFLDKEYVNIDSEIINKYSFDNWLKRILELE